MRALLYSTLVLIFLPQFLNAQKISVTLNCGDSILQGEVVELFIEIEDLPTNQFVLPEMVGLRVFSRPSTSSQMSIINGVRSSKTVYKYRLLAFQPGLAVVNSFSLPYGEKQFESPELTVFVNEDPTFIDPGNTPSQGNPALPNSPQRPSKPRRPTTKL